MASSLEEIKPEIATHLRNLLECNDFTEDLVPSLSRLSSMVLNCSDRNAIRVFMIQEGFDELCLKMLTALLSCWKNIKPGFQSYQNLQKVLNLTAIITDGCLEFGDALIVRGCVSVLLEMSGVHTEEQIDDIIRMLLLNVMKLEIDKHLRNFKECKDFTDDLGPSLSRLSSMVLNSSDPRAIGVYMIHGGLDEMCLKMLTVLSNCWKNIKPEFQSYRNLQKLLHLTINVTDGCREFGDALVAGGCISVLLKMTGLCTEEQDNIDILTILFNIIRLSANNRAVFRDANAIAIVKPFLESSNMLIQTVALMVLAYVINEKEREILATSKYGLIQLIQLLKKCVTSQSQKSSIEGTTTTFSVFEILDAINRLAINDTSKTEIEKQGAVPAIIRVLEDDFSDEDHRVAVEVLWNLSFVESIRDSEDLQSTIPTLEKLGKSNNIEVQRVCAAAIWQIKGSKSEDVRSSSKTRPPSILEVATEPGSASKSAAAIKVMLSYQWDYQKRILKIREKLENDGYNVWMDISHMEGDILGAMANAVEESDVILMCMSERYRDSKSCRSEVTYAYKLEKKIIPLLLEPEYKPDGWLGLLQGMDLYYMCHSDEELDRNMPALLKVIGESNPTRAKDVIDGPITMITPKMPSVTQSISPDGPSSPPAAASWSAKEVQDWLGQKNLKRPELEDFEGCDLQELYTSLIKDVEKFKDDLKSDYGMNRPNCIRFTARLKQLFQQ